MDHGQRTPAPLSTSFQSTTTSIRTTIFDVRGCCSACHRQVMAVLMQQGAVSNLLEGACMPQLGLPQGDCAQGSRMNASPAFFPTLDYNSMQRFTNQLSVYAWQVPPNMHVMRLDHYNQIGLYPFMSCML